MEQRDFLVALTAFLTTNFQSDLEALLEQLDVDKGYGFEVSIVELAHFSFAAASQLLADPLPVLQLFSLALIEAESEILQLHPDRPELSLKERVHVRLASLPWHAGGAGPAGGPNLGGVRSAHVGRLLTVRGTVLRASAVQMLEVERTYACRKCKHRFTVRADPESQVLPRPGRCPAFEETGCKGTNFTEMEAERLLADYQEVRLQARTQGMAMGAMPAVITALLFDDLVDCCQPGDDISVTAVVLRQWKPPLPGVRCETTLVLHANHVAVLNERKGCVEVTPNDAATFEGFWAHHADSPLRGRNAIIGSVCPQLHGLFAVKLALLLMLVGGLTHVSDSGMHIRGDIHMLLVGDPGTGKSQLMKYASQLCPRTVVTSGTGASAAGLTATAVREGASWGLQAGALVLADCGLCCIDEFDGIKEADRATIHEAMEQQTISIAKAGLMTTLNARTSVFGIVNPKRKAGSHSREVAPTTLSGPLLSRFDILLLLEDPKDANMDALIASHILDGHQRDATAILSPQGWSVEVLQKYISWVKTECAPVLAPEAEVLLTRYYQLQRRLADRMKARTTIRMLESLLRLAQAHARLMARQDEVTEQDALFAVAIVESTMAGSELNFLRALLCEFDADPEATYQETRARLFDIMKDSGPR